MELVINKVEDIAKLEGWTIKGAAIQVTAGVDPVINFTLAHPAAEHDISLAVIATVSFGRSGNVMVVNALLAVHSEDVGE